MAMAWRLTVVAAMALLVAGCASQETPETAGDADTPGDAEATFVAADSVFSEAPEQLSSGELAVELVNDGALLHNVTIEELDDLLVVQAGGGESATGTVTLEPGSYTYYCSVPGHREAGMEGTLTVE